MESLRIKRLILNLILAIFAGVFLASAIAFAIEPLSQPIKAKDSIKPNYVPNEIIVKFKDTTAQVLESELVQKIKSLRDVKLASSLDNLNKKHRVKEFKQIFPNFKKDRQRLENLKLRDKVRTKYNIKQIKFTKQEEHLLKRLSHAPKDAKVPDLDRIYKLELEKGQSIEEAVAEYSKDPNIEYAQPNYIYTLYAEPLPPKEDFPYLPNDHYIENDQNPGYWREGSWGQNYSDLWGLKNIQAIEAWNLFDTNKDGRIDGNEKLPGEGVIVAVIDTGVDYNHEDLRENIWNNEDEIPDNGIDDDGNGYIDDIRGYDISDGDNNPTDYVGHGTHCAGTIAATGNNEIGIAGVAYGAKIMPVKIFPRAYSDVCAAGIRYAAFSGADVLSNSWGPEVRNPSDPTIEAAVDDAYTEGCVIVFAAGNNNDDVAYYSPANYSKTIAVAATDFQDNRASFSNYGGKIDMAAPGVEVLSLRAEGTDMYLGTDGYTPGARIVNGSYYRANGTSMACPHVAGLAALILSENLELSNNVVRNIMQCASDDIGAIGKDPYFGYGRMSAYRSLVFVMGGFKMGLSYPFPNSFVRGTIDIVGTGYGDGENFLKYELYCAPLDDPLNTTLIACSYMPVINGLLGTWNTLEYPEGDYVLNLKVFTMENEEFNIFARVIIDNINQPPVFEYISNKGAVIDRLLEFKIEAHDPDDPQIPWGQIVEYSAANLPPHAQFNPQTQVFSWQPDESEKGNYQVTFNVRDNYYTVSKDVDIHTIYIIESPITRELGCGWADIYNNKIVYGRGMCDIYMYDLSSNNERQITNSENTDNKPRIYGDKIVWDRVTSTYSYSVDMYDLSLNKETHIVYPKTPPGAVIYGDKIIYIKVGTDGNKCVYMYDINTQEETKITNTSCNEPQQPYIYQNTIAYEDNRNGDWDIYMYDIDAQKETRITSDVAHQTSPVIYQNKIIYQDSRNEKQFSGYGKGNWDIYMHDISTGQERQITSNVNPQIAPHAYEDKIVWCDARNDRPDVYLYDLSTEQEYRITDNCNRQIYPRIYENKVIWLDGRDDPMWGGMNLSVYMARLYFVPEITSINCSTLVKGDVFTINGKNLGYPMELSQSQVVFENGAICEIENWTNTSITARVPNGAQTGLLKVITLGGESNGIMVDIAEIPPAPPQLILPPEPISGNEGKLLEFTVQATDTDSETLTFTHPTAEELAITAPGATFIDHGNKTATFSWIPDASQVGVYDITFTVSDGVSTDSETITIGVAPAAWKGVLPASSVQEAIDNSLSGDNIYIFNGTHEEDIELQDKNLSINGESTYNTVIKGNISLSNSNSTIENLTIKYNDGNGLIYSNGYYMDFKLLNDAGITAVNSTITVKNSVIQPDLDAINLSGGYDPPLSHYGKGIQIWNLYGTPNIAPIIENCMISNADTGIYLYSQAFGGVIGGNISKNTLDLNNYGIVMRMHKESPLIRNNIITHSIDAIHLTYNSLLSKRLANMANNCFGIGEFSNTHNIWCDTLQKEQLTRLDTRGNIAEDPDFDDYYPYLSYYPQNPNCSDMGCRLK